MKKGLKDAKQFFAVEKTKPPYTEKGKTTFSIRNKAGVYLIYDKKELVYIGFSTSDVYKALYRHLQRWNDNTQQRIVFNSVKGLTVRVVYCVSGVKARKLEGALILKHKPPLNINKYKDFVLDIDDKNLISTYEETKPEIYQHKGDLPF